ncbi:MAG: hypothetical protein KatS3mg125_1137 [Lysobacterales bacterium]|nr:MAG: hypothetical protein KatS3mg125_1137 [Xanthomonadales bacterium]
MRVFRFLDARYEAGEARLVYAFDGGPELTESLRFPGAPAVPPERAEAFERALALTHWIAGVSYYKAFAPARIECATAPPDPAVAAALERIYVEGLAEFSFRNGIDLRGRVRFPSAQGSGPRPSLSLPRRTLLPLGGGKDSLVALEMLREVGEPLLPVWVGRSALIEACAERAGLPAINVDRQIAPELFELNRQGALNGHVPVTAIHSAIMVLVALLYGADAIAFANERSADLPTRVIEGRGVNHQWSKSLDFERLFRTMLGGWIGAGIEYFSLLRPFSELAVAARFSRMRRYFDVFSSCNRNFRILGTRPASRWCGECPKCHFVYLAMAPFLPKPELAAVFGRNLLDEESLIPAYAALAGIAGERPFECVGEPVEVRAALAALAEQAAWREDAVIAAARRWLERLPPPPSLGELLRPSGPHHLPSRLESLLDAPH